MVEFQFPSQHNFNSFPRDMKVTSTGSQFTIDDACIKLTNGDVAYDIKSIAQTEAQNNTKFPSVVSVLGSTLYHVITNNEMKKSGCWKIPDGEKLVGIYG